MIRREYVILLIIFTLQSSGLAIIFRTPEEVMDCFFRNWKLQNQTYMENSMQGSLSAFGRLMSRQYLIDYNVEWAEIYKGIHIVKIKTKMKSVEYGLQTRNFYFFFEKKDGSWKMLNGYQVKRNMSAKEAYNFFIWVNSL